ncbi:(deoxy)nucleoside triphosphate pyrophosphohydrolase [Alkalimarinus coralli]|uniref:(deoxy)nucleoside triphosphate pyrophosphohydrolase n=1 Tax=Alkalimarinus coralli TaxID=2935863 RepID=UPI00202B547B|nr:(deoxy)nucleoside triphosphate pyrophosphohydrolase [Alkalimarinus coralli]
MKEIDVVAAIIKCGDEILCVQRGAAKFEYISDKYEFPGGKIEIKETKEDAIIREIKEELKLNIVEPKFFHTVNYQYPDFFITMHSYICLVDSKEVVLTEHIDHKWLKVEELGKLDWAAADIPIVKQLQKHTI